MNTPVSSAIQVCMLGVTCFTKLYASEGCVTHERMRDGSNQQYNVCIMLKEFNKIKIK